MENVRYRRDIEELTATFGNKLEAQVEHEQRMVVLGQQQMEKAIAKAREHGNESRTGYGQTIIARGIDEVAQAVLRFIDEAGKKAGRRHIALKYLTQVDPEVAAFIALRCIVDGLSSQKVMLQRVAVRIGSQIEDEVRFAEFKDTAARAYSYAVEKAKSSASYHRKKASMSGYERRFTESEWVSWPEQDRLHVGMKLIEIIVATELVDIADQITTRKDTAKVIMPSPKLAEWVDREAHRSTLMQPSHSPMIVPPLDWTTPFDGGYLTVDAQGRNPLVKTGNKNYLMELGDHAHEMPTVYESVNALQRTAWAINNGIYNVAQHMWNELELEAGVVPARADTSHCACSACGEFVKMPAMNTRFKAEHDCFADEDVLRQWKRDAYMVHRGNAASRSKRLRFARTLSEAAIYKDEEAIFFPYQLDFRGRIYAIPTFNPQGDDLTKALLHFSEGKPLKDAVAAGWLAVHGANVYGYDKDDLSGRIGWVEEHEEQIKACANDPYSNLFWTEADKPWQFLAFCFEWAGFLEQGFGFVSHIAVALDGSCSGIQHFSAMLRDTVGGSAVNLVPSDKPSDIYQKVCDVALAKLRIMADELTPTIAKANSAEGRIEWEEAEGKEAIANLAKAMGDEWSEQMFAAALLSFGMNRKATKRQVMTLPYGATLYSCREYTEEWLKEKIEAGTETLWPEAKTGMVAIFLSKVIWDSIGEVVVAARDAMGWLQKCAKLVASEDLPVHWTTPVGFRVLQSYKNTQGKRVDTKMGDSVIKLTLSQEIDTMNKRRMTSAISPNVVHSLDASHLMLTVAYGVDNGIHSFALIHDSFGTHAADTELFAAVIRRAFVDLYEEVDVIEDLREQFQRQVEETLPACPPKGSLDLTCVLDSDFCFA